MAESPAYLASTKRKGPSGAMVLENTPVGPAPARSKAATCCFRKSLLRCRWFSGLLRNWMRRSSRITFLAASAAAALPAASVEAAAGRNARLVIEPAWYQTCGRKMETAPIREKPEPGKSSIHRGDAEISAEKTKQKKARRKGGRIHTFPGARAEGAEIAEEIRRVAAILAATRIACFMLRGSARFFPAMSKAVP